MILFTSPRDTVPPIMWPCYMSIVILFSVDYDHIQRGLWSYSLSYCDINPVKVWSDSLNLWYHSGEMWY